MTQQHRARDGGIEAWRDQLLSTILRLMFVLGVLVAVPSIAFAAATDQTFIVVVDIVAVAAIAVLVFVPRLGYRVRAVGLVTLAYLLGVALLSSVGLVSHVYLLAFPVLTAVLLGLWPAIVALGINAATLTTAGLLGAVDPRVEILGIDSSIEWLVITGNFLFVNAAMAISCAVLLTRLERSLDAELATTASLSEQREHLARANQELGLEIAQRIRAEAEVERLAAAVAQARDVVVTAEPDGRITYRNHAYQALVAAFDLDGSITSLDELGTDERARADLREAIDAGREWAGLITFRSATGDELEFDTHVAPVSSADTPVSAFVGVLRDVTHERRMEARLRQAEKLEALGTLASGTAHDFNNVLGSILAVAESTASRTDDATVREDMDVIAHACARARDVVQQMMAFGRRTDVDRQPSSLQALIDGSLPLLRAALPANITIRTDLHDDGHVLARPSELDQILANLANNAAHAMGDDPAATLTLCLTVADVPPEVPPGAEPSPTADGRTAVLTVSDNGVGIDPAHLGQLFDPFFTTKHPTEGTGLGLPSVHAIVTSLGGDIDVDTAPGRGTSFTIRIPTVVADLPPDGAITDRSGPDPVVSGRLLFVDDEETILLMAERALTRAGYEVTTARDGGSARDLFLADPHGFDVLVTDLTMPGLSGVALIAAVHAVRPGLPVILCSGYGTATEIDELPPTALHAYLAKPYTLAELTSQVRTAVAPAGEVGTT